MADENVVIRALKKIKKIKKKAVLAAIILVVTFIMWIGPIFWGTIKETFNKASSIFTDVLDNVKISGNDIEIDQDYLTEAKRKLEVWGIDENSLGLSGHEEYLERFLEAEIVTNYPYLGGDGLQGTVYFERANVDGSTIELKYKSYDEFYNMANNNDSELYQYFTVDTNDWTVHVGKSQVEGSFAIEKINYKDMVSKFSMPFEFPISLAMVTQNPQFALAVVNLVKKSKIVVTIAESMTTTITDTVYSYNKKITQTTTGDGNTTVISDDVHSSMNRAVSTSYSTQVVLSRANTWILNEITELSYDNSTQAQQPQVTDLEDNNESNYDSGVITQTYTYNRKNTVSVTNEYKRWKRGSTKVIEKTKNFTSLILRDTTGTNGNGLVAIAKKCHDELANAGFVYGATSAGIPININSDSYVDCSGFVSWVLYEAGYEDMAGDQHNTSNGSLGAYGQEKGWDVIDNYEELEPGDICFWGGNLNGSNPYHVNIFVEKNGDSYTFYDCGYTKAIQQIEPLNYSISDFGYAFRPNDDIAQALSPTTTEDLKEKINTYISGLSGAKYSVSVKDLNKSSNSFSLNNDKIKSEGYLKLFIMATAYNQINKGNIKEEDFGQDIEIMITTDNYSSANNVLKALGKINNEDENDDSKLMQNGIEKVQEYINQSGCTGTKLKEMLSSVGSDKNTTKVSEVATLLNKIYSKKCVNKKYSEKMLELLQGQILTELIPSTIEAGTVGNKTGEQQGVLQDSAIVSIDTADYIAVISATDITDRGQSANEIKEISKQIYAYFLKNGNKINNSNNTAEDDEIKTIMNGRRVCYKVPGLGYQCPLSNLVEGHEMLFDLLASSEKTQKHEELMRYLMYLLTGKSYGVTEFDFTTFLNGSFSGSGGAWCVLWSNGCTREEFIAAVNAFQAPDSTYSGRSMVECYDKYFKANAGNFYDICTKNGIDPRFVFSIGIHESAYGTSNIANTKGNFWGWGAFDSDPMGGAHGFNDMSNGIESVSSGLHSWATPGSWQYDSIISKGYDPTTVEGIGSVYASDPAWAEAVKGYMTKIFGCTGESGVDASGTDMQNKIVQIAASQDTLGCAAFWCQKWVADVYAAAGQSRVSACCASQAAANWIVSTSRDNIPIGAAVYGAGSPPVYCSGCGRSDAGHVGIYIGNGQVASNVGGIRIESLDSWASSFAWKGWGWNGGIDYSK